MSVRLASPTGRYVQDIPGRQRGRRLPARRRLKVEGPATADWATYVATYANVPPARRRPTCTPGWAPAYLDAQQGFEQFYSLRTPPAGLESSY